MFVLTPLRGKQPKMDVRCVPTALSTGICSLPTSSHIVHKGFYWLECRMLSNCSRLLIYLVGSSSRSGNLSGFKRGNTSVMLICRRFPAREFQVDFYLNPSVHLVLQVLSTFPSIFVAARSLEVSLIKGIFTRIQNISSECTRMPSD